MTHLGQKLRRRSRALAARGDRGALSLELVIIFPAVLMLILIAVHVGLWWHARNTALSAAQLGVEAARQRHASIGDGTAETRAFLDRAGGSISSRQVAGSRGQTVRIEVTGYVETMIPGLRLRVDQHADASVERVTETP
ncbi:TadE family protein [Streptomyces sp. MZ04]|uniref:TadE family protein n=1 Tax=Streptomyces sp. MZ04 TaxID=2559236 RepID=UPI00107E6F18|nr:TadE family protein [Streptomyces sp. MZ04]TGB15518.1 pilus assembly protein [Streptomyces sp. MZ04]